jgi:hypothetical protein
MSYSNDEDDEPIVRAEKKFMRAEDAFQSSVRGDASHMKIKAVRKMVEDTLKNMDKTEQLVRDRMRMCQAQDERDTRWIEWVDLNPRASPETKKEHRMTIDRLLADNEKEYQLFSAMMAALKARDVTQLPSCDE